MTNDFPFVATNSFVTNPANSYIQQQQAFMTGLAAKLEQDNITAPAVEEQEIEALCAEVEPEVQEDNRGVIITSLAVFAGLTAFTLKHGVTFILTLLTYLDSEIADNLLGAK